jgi:hypothetical protein
VDWQNPDREVAAEPGGGGVLPQGAPSGQPKMVNVD